MHDVVDEPRAVVIPQVMVGILRIGAKRELDHDVVSGWSDITGDLIRSGKQAGAHIALRPTRALGSTLVSPTRLADSAKSPNHS
jgi:hypothetical protein